jgi:Tfp pilus assembly protein FimT
MLTISATRLTPCTKKPAKPLVFASTGRGFTLLEALLALGLMALVAGVALPRWLGQQARQHLQLAGASLQRAAWLAQLHAAQTQQPVTLQPLPATACAAQVALARPGEHPWPCGWALVPAGASQPWQQARWPRGVSVSGNGRAAITFAPSGQTRQWQTLQLRAHHTAASWRATVSVLGRVNPQPNTP